MVIHLDSRPEYARALAETLRRRACKVRHATYNDVARMSAQILAAKPPAPMVSDVVRILQRAIRRLDQEEAQHAES